MKNVVHGQLSGFVVLACLVAACGTSGSKSDGTGAAGSAGGGAGSTGSAGAGGTTATVGSVLQHHNDLARDGVYVDARLTKTAVATLHLDTAFANTALMGPVYAQPLYLAGSGGKPDMVIVASERNQVYALDASSGAMIWSHSVGTPVSTGLPCGRIAVNGNTLGVTGTPVIDAATRTLYLDAMTADTTATAKHFIHALDLDNQGNERTGWPVDVNATAASGGTTFNSLVQNQRAALTLLGGKVFVPYGGHIGDCMGYHGWLVGVSTSDPSQVTAWATRAVAGGIWGASGITSDGTSLFVATGNTKASAAASANTNPTQWGDGETVFKFATSLAAPPMTAATDFFVPSNWIQMDDTDQDIGGTSPVLIDVPGATPSRLLMALGKDGKAYLLNPANLGGMDAQPLATATTVASRAIIQASVAYKTAMGSYVVFKNGGAASGCPAGQTGGLSAIKITAASPPTLSVAWCGGPALGSSPTVTMTDAAGSDTIVWAVGTDNKLHGVDGDTGQSVFAGGADTATGVQAIQVPIVVNGRIFVGSDTRVYAFTP